MEFKYNPDYRQPEKAGDIKNEIFVAQAKLIARSPLSETDWVERYAEIFRHMAATDDAFRELLTADHSPDNLRRLQEMLDEEAAK